MAFETGTATDLENLIATISTFLTTNGWTEDRRDNAAGIVGWSKNSIFVSGRWDTSAKTTLALYQATAVLPGSGTEPGDVTGDSGNGFNTTTSHLDLSLGLERHVTLGDGPFPSYYIFEQDASPAYIHIVVETSTGIFAHFGFGELDKFGDGWTGGEYVYGSVHKAGTENNPAGSWLLDGLSASSASSDERRVATIRMTGFPNQIAGSIYGNVWGNTRFDSVIPDDTAGNDKVAVQGGYRGGPFSTPWVVFSGSKTTGLVPMYSIGLFHVDNVNNFVYFMGYQADVRGVNIRNFSPKEEVVVGSDTWVLFPGRQRDISNGTGTTAYAGIAYKKVTA